MENVTEVHLKLNDKPLDDDLFTAISRLILLTSNAKKFLKTCPSPELVSEKYAKRKIKLEDTLAEINKIYGWG